MLKLGAKLPGGEVSVSRWEPLAMDQVPRGMEKAASRKRFRSTQ